MFTQLLARSPAKVAGERLHGAAVRQARREVLYGRMGVPDTVEGRFELQTLHVILLVDRLKVGGGEAAHIRQALFDSYLSNLDGALREMGVGDLVVGKRMRKLGEAFYGRARAYDAAFQALPNLQPLQEILDRTVLHGATAAAPEALAAYVVRCREALAAQDVSVLVAGLPPWPLP